MADETVDPVVDPIDDPNPDPEPEPQPEPEPEPDDSDKNLATEQAAYRARMEKLGARFDAAGEFVGWAEGTTSVTTQDEPDPFDMQGQLEKTRRSMMEKTRPSVIATLVSGVLADNPRLAPYSKQVTALLEKVDVDLLTPDTALGYFLYSRGMAADVEIAAAVKEDRVKRSEKGAAAAAATSEPPTSTVVAPPNRKANAKVTEEIARYAKQWGLDPQVVANKMAEEKARREGKTT